MNPDDLVTNPDGSVSIAKDAYIPDSLPAFTQANPPTNPLLGGIGKSFDTFLDALAVQGAGKIIGTNYPTGQQNPAALAAANHAASLQQPQFNFRPWLIGGGIALGSILAIAVIFRVTAK